MKNIKSKDKVTEKILMEVAIIIYYFTTFLTTVLFSLLLTFIT